MTSASEENGDLSIFFLVQGTGGSPTGPDPENRVGDKTLEAQIRQFLLGCKCPVKRNIVVQEHEHLGELRGVFPSKCPSFAPVEMSNTQR